MKLIVHIGTPKTGTTSIQHYCSKNKKLLEKNRILYPLFGSFITNHNELALLIARNKLDEAKNIINKILKKANDKNIKTILISAEIFFAMEIALNFNKKKDSEYFINYEKEKIENFYSLLNHFCNIEIHCFLRRQDLFAESFYNQKIKKSSLDCDINKFIQILDIFLDYNKTLSIWSDVFGRSNINVHSYDFNKNSINNYFIKNVAGITNSSDFTPVIKQVNKSPSREVIEFNRMLNKINMSKSEYFIAARAIKNISRKLGSYEKASYLSNIERSDLLDKYSDGNENIENNYLKNNNKLFLNVTKNTSNIYAEIDSAKLIVIMMMYISYINKPTIQIELFIRKYLRRLIQLSPIFDWLLQPVRILMYRDSFHYPRFPVELGRGCGYNLCEIYFSM